MVGLITVVAEPAARADGAGALARDLANAEVQRSRRAIALGPTLGVAGVYVPPPASEADLGITFGFALRMFSIPRMSDPKDVILDRVREGGDAGEMVKDVAGQFVGELTGRRPRPGKTLEKPRLAVTLEGTRLLNLEAWQVRGVVAIGIWKVTVGPVITGHIGPADGLLLGGELAVHLTPKQGPRSPVIDVYVRGELGVIGEVEDAELVTVGTRFVLDLI